MWKQIDGYRFLYRISDLGEVQRQMSEGVWKPVKPWLTEAGVLVPCAHCGGEAKFKKGFPSRQIAHCRQAVVQCKKCGVRTVTHRQLPMERWQDVDRAAIEEWNTRALILSAAEMELLEKEAQP